MTTRPESVPENEDAQEKCRQTIWIKKNNNNVRLTLSTGNKSGIIGMDIDAEYRQTWQKDRNTKNEKGWRLKLSTGIQVTWWWHRDTYHRAKPSAVSVIACYMIANQQRKLMMKVFSKISLAEKWGRIYGIGMVKWIWRIDYSMIIAWIIVYNKVFIKDEV